MTAPAQPVRAHLPETHAVRLLLEDLTGRDTDLSVSTPIDVSAGAVVAAEMRTDDGVLAGLMIMDLSAAACLGAAIALMPKGIAQECVKDGELTPILLENLGEVCNVVSGLFNKDGSPHVRLGAVVPTPKGGALPAEIAAFAAGSIRSVDVSIEVKGYLTGRISLLH
jgi:hypothetical protein